MKKTLFVVLLISAAIASGCVASRHAVVDSEIKTITELADAACIQNETQMDKVYVLLPVYNDEPRKWSGRDLVRTRSHPEIHGPYSLSILGDFIAPSWSKLDEAYGMDSRFLIRAFDDIYLGCSFSYAKVKNDFTKGLIEGELHRYTALFWTEYRLRFGQTAWSPSVDFCLGPGWYVGEPVPLSEELKAIESAGQRLRTSIVSTAVIRMAAQLRLPVLRSTDMSISEGNADLILGIGAEFGEGITRYKIYDYTAGTKTVSRGHMILDAFHTFIGLSFRF